MLELRAEGYTPAMSPDEQSMEAGVAWLDQRDSPGWVHRVDVEHLNMRNGTQCLLGQLHRNYHLAMAEFRLGYDEAVRLAFTLSTADSENDQRWGDLTEAWQDKISELKKVRLDYL